MASGQGWQQKVAANFLQEGELKVEREFQLKFSWSKLKVSKRVLISK